MSHLSLVRPRGVHLREVCDPALSRDLPADPEEPAFPGAARVLCSCCGEAGDSVGAVRHPAWCIYADGPVCPSIPN